MSIINIHIRHTLGAEPLAASRPHRAHGRARDTLSDTRKRLGGRVVGAGEYGAFGSTMVMLLFIVLFETTSYTFGKDTLQTLGMTVYTNQG